MPTLPHTPSYDTALQFAYKTLKKRMEDGSFMARTKGAGVYTFDVVYKGRPISEFTDILAFYNTYGEVAPFDYTSPTSGATVSVTFDTPVKGTISSFDTMDFGFTLVQWVDGGYTP